MLLLICRNKLRNYRPIIEELITNVAPRIFTYAELQRAMNDFKEELGKGVFGTVYKGIISNYEKVVAVKKLEKILAEGDT